MSAPHRPDAQTWQQVRALFEACLDCPSGEREACLAAAAVEESVRAEVRSLLASHDDEASPDPLAAAPVQPADEPQASRAGQRFGAWQIVAAVGAGGMGEVFEARRGDGSFEGRAAVKLLKRGMDSAGVLRRFAQERQALARLNHPNIARLLDAGLSADGLPYVVMEFIDGVAIDLAARPLPVDARLALFLQLADAVAHAHRSLLVHRDLKPGNVLVTPEGQVKLLDFGIAKALDAEDDDGHTTVGTQRPFTPNYASPEQVRGEPVNTATDVYSLGVILHELLTGVRPTGRGASTLAEAARRVLSEEPSAPSALSGEQTGDPQWSATQRRLRGDLDNIVLKALQKSPERRYASVNELARDLRDHLRGHPVSARPLSRRYLVGKFIARHTGTVVAAGAALTAVFIGLGATAWQAHRADQQRDVAERRLKDIRAITSQVILQFSDAISYLPGGLKLKEKLLSDTLGHLDRLAAEADADPAFKGEIATAYARLADVQVENNLNSLDKDALGEQNAMKAITLFEQAQAAPERDAPFYLWWTRALKSRALVERGKGRLDEGLAFLARARVVAARGVAQFPRDLDIASELGSTVFLIGQFNDSAGQASKGDAAAAASAFDEAHRLYLAMYELDRAQPELSPDDHSSYAYQLGTIEGARALMFGKQARYAEAVAHHAAAVRWREQALALEPDNVAYRSGLSGEANNEAWMCLDVGDLDCGLRSSERAWSLLVRLQRQDPRDPPWTHYTALQRGRALLAQGQATEALAVLKALEASPAKGSAPLRRQAAVRLLMASALQQTGQAAEAARLAGQAADTLAGLVTADPGDRDGWLWSARLAAERWRWPGADRAALRTQALAAFERTAALAALPDQGPDVKLRQALLASRP